jgi:hypothetical protein
MRLICAIALNGRNRRSNPSMKDNIGATTARTYHTSGNGSMLVTPDVAHHSAIATASTKSS